MSLKFYYHVIIGLILAISFFVFATISNKPADDDVSMSITPTFDDVSMSISPTLVPIEARLIKVVSRKGTLTLTTTSKDKNTEFKITGLPYEGNLLECQECAFFSRVYYSPEGPSQIVTILDRNNIPVVVLGFNTEDTFPLFDEPKIGAEVIELGISVNQVVLKQFGKDVKQHLPSAQMENYYQRLIIEKSPIVVDALDNHWRLHLLGLEKIEETDVVSVDYEHPKLMLNWMLTTTRG